MKIEQRKFRIGKLANHLNIKASVIRFWEKEFTMASTRSIGGQRYYTQKDIQQFFLIKELLYNQGLTIFGAKKHLASHNLVSHKKNISAF